MIVEPTISFHATQVFMPIQLQTKQVQKDGEPTEMHRGLKQNWQYRT